MKSNGRETALEVLTACRRLDAWSDGSLRSACRRNELDRREAALAARLTYGVLQNLALLDFYLDAYCVQPVEDMEPFVRDVLRLGTYQILFMDKIPDSAAVNEAVEMVKRHRRARASGMVNAVLRRLSRERERLPAIPASDPAQALSIRYSHPRWLVERLLGLLGREETEAFLADDNAPAPLEIQYNPLKTTCQELEAAFAPGVLTPHGSLPGCYQLTAPGDLEGLESFQRGLFQVQDPAAKLAVLAAAPRPGDRVIDVCAAPGGKSFACAMAMENRGSILSCDIHRHKLALVQEGARRLGVTILETALADGREDHPQWAESADLVLCDVPCSGLGVIRKKPDIRYKDPAALAALPQVQGDILKNAARYVKPGGTLLYATCTILPEENRGVTEAFLSEDRTFVREPFSLPGIGDVGEGELTLWPQRHGTDGFYFCKMRKL